jgi:hypothetical protein
VHREELEVQWAHALRYDVVFVLPRSELDAIHSLGEQVDRRCAIWVEQTRLDLRVQFRIVPVQQNHDVELGTESAAYDPFQALQTHKKEPLRKGEVLMQETIAVERAGTARQQRLGRIESERLDLGMLQKDPVGLFCGLARARRDSNRIGTEVLVDQHRYLVLAAQVQIQRIQGQFGELQARAYP